MHIARIHKVRSLLKKHAPRGVPFIFPVYGVVIEFRLTFGLRYDNQREERRNGWQRAQRLGDRGASKRAKGRRGLARVNEHAGIFKVTKARYNYCLCFEQFILK